MENLKYITVGFLVPDDFNKDDLLHIVQQGVAQGYKVWDAEREGYFQLEQAYFKSVWDSDIPIIEIKISSNPSGSYTRGV